MYFIGCTRFSVYIPGSQAWHLSRVSEQEYRNQLFADERLKVRFDIFFNKAAPIYAQMSEGCFYKHIVQYSYLLPQKWKKYLKEQAQMYDFIVLSEVGPEPAQLPILDILKDQLTGTLVYFRVDDDDLLSKKYLTSLCLYAKPEYQGMIVSFGLGLIATYKAGNFMDFRVYHKPFLSQGMAFIGSYDATKKRCQLPARSNHIIVDKFSPTIVDSREPMFIAAYHRAQDTFTRSNNADAAVNLMINTHQRIESLQPYADLFPTIADDIKKMLKVYENGETILKNTRLNSNRIDINIPIHQRSTQFMIDYCITAESYISTNSEENMEILEKMFILSIDFDNNPPSVKGLILSTSREIGWYSYVSLQNGIGKGQIQITLDTPSSIRNIHVQKWKTNEATPVTINHIKLFTIGVN